MQSDTHRHVLALGRVRDSVGSAALALGRANTDAETGSSSNGGRSSSSASGVQHELASPEAYDGWPRWRVAIARAQAEADARHHAARAEQACLDAIVAEADARQRYGREATTSEINRELRVNRNFELQSLTSSISGLNRSLSSHSILHGIGDRLDPGSAHFKRPALPAEGANLYEGPSPPAVMSLREAREHVALNDQLMNAELFNGRASRYTDE